MKLVENQKLSGERALFRSRNLEIKDTLFFDGESPLKESKNIDLHNCTFDWKYPLWHCRNVKAENCTLTMTGRAGIWYTKNIDMKNCEITAPKTFRRTKNITLENVNIPNAEETLWLCDGFYAKNIKAKGNYFGMNSKNIVMDNFELDGNYPFDGGKNIEIRNSVLISKDAFWNAENVTVYDSVIRGEYLGWNSRNLTFVNCTIESLQGLCCIENLKLVNCVLENTTLAFEYSTVDADVNSNIDSVFNPKGGVIRAKGIDKLIMEKDKINPEKTKIIIK